MKRVLCALLAVAVLLGMTACANTEKDWQEQYDLGMRYLEEGDFEEAILVFSAAIEIDPDRPEAYMGRAEAYIGIGDKEKALQDYKRAQRTAKNGDDYDDLLDELEDLIEQLEEIIDNPEEETTPKPGAEELQLIRVETRGSDGMLIYRTEMRYDDQGRLVETLGETYSDTGNLLGQYSNRFAYDDAGRLLRITYGETGEKVYTYDAEGRLLETSLTDGGWYRVTYEYDSDGHRVGGLEESQVSSTVVTYTCDGYGRVVEEYRLTTHEYGTSEARTSYTYNELGRLVGKTEQWAEGTHYTAYHYLNGLVAEEVTYDYTPETDYIFRIQDAAGNGLWAISVTEGGYTLDDQNRVLQAAGYSYDNNGLTEVTTTFHYSDMEESDTEEGGTETESGSETGNQEVRIDLDGLLSGVQLDYPDKNVSTWSDRDIAYAIYCKINGDYAMEDRGDYLSRLGLTGVQREDGYIAFPLDKIQELTKATFGRAFPDNTGLDIIRVSGNEVLLSFTAGESHFMYVQDHKLEGDTITAVGIRVYANGMGQGVLGYFEAVAKVNPGSVFGCTLQSLEHVEGNQSFRNLTARASSELVETYTYYATNVLDGRLDTAWVEGVNGLGINEWIQLETVDGSKMELSAIGFALGYQKSEDILAKNGWPTEVLIECEGGYRQTVRFWSYTDLAVICPGIRTSWVKITILNALEGTKYSDICISEISLYGLNTGTETQESDAYAMYKDYFYANYSAGDIVYLADVTHDGMEDMIVVNFSDEYRSEVYGHVYTLQDGNVVEIYTKQGSDYHAGGFFAWYLVPVPGSDYWNLASESFGMWQGIGTLTYSEYQLTNGCMVMECAYLELDSEDEGNHDANGVVTEAAMNDYVAKLNRELENCYRIYCSASNGSGSKSLDTSPASVFAK